MFDEHAFLSWPLILGGAFCFAALFVLAVALGELLFDGVLRVTRISASMGAAAFVGYLLVAVLGRRDASSGEG